MERINLFGLILSFAGSVILGLGMIRSSDRIEKESGMYWGGNPYTKQFFYADRKIGVFGVGLLGLGFLLQLVALYL